MSGPADDTALSVHPVVAAWTAVAPTSAPPTAVETIKDRPKSSVYRLLGVGPDRTGVVAKRTRAALARHEHLLYDRVLPRLGLPVLTSRGLLDSGAGSSWIFVDYCGGMPFRSADAEHGALAARWFARMHLQGADAVREVDLPDRSTNTYRAHLRAARAQVAAARSAPALRTADTVLLDRVLADCSALEDAWEEVEVACRFLPPTLVHGDAKPANLLVRRGPGGRHVVPIDWEEAGRGPAVVDLAYVDGAVYWDEIGGAWGDVDRIRQERLRVLGLTFQWLVVIDKVSRCLADPGYVGRAMDQLGWFGAHLTRALRVLAIQRVPAA